MVTTTFELPQRSGPPPATRRPSQVTPGPHQQVSLNAPPHLQEALFTRARLLPSVTVGASLVSVPGARAFHLDDTAARGPHTAFQRGREFAHLHPPHDGSLHLTLDAGLYQDVLAKGWGEPHPISGAMMVWGPRNDEELEIVWNLVRASYQYATGQLG